MITGDLVKCNDTGSLGIVTRVSELPLSTPGLFAVDYKILWPEGSMSWENTDTVTPLSSASYAP
jgi:hypothetical protein